MIEAALLSGVGLVANPPEENKNIPWLWKCVLLVVPTRKDKYK